MVVPGVTEVSTTSEVYTGWCYFFVGHVDVERHFVFHDFYVTSNAFSEANQINGYVLSTCLIITVCGRVSTCSRYSFFVTPTWSVQILPLKVRILGYFLGVSVDAIASIGHLARATIPALESACNEHTRWIGSNDGHIHLPCY